MSFSGQNDTILEQLDPVLVDSDEGLRGLTELREVFSYLQHFKIQNAKVEFDTTLARGLSYYTGCIFEVKVNNVQMGSISGGGRYDNLTGMFGLPNVSGVGFSFGVDRIYDVMEELQLFDQTVASGTKVLISNFDKAAEIYSLPILQNLRECRHCRRTLSGSRQAEKANDLRR